MQYATVKKQSKPITISLPECNRQLNALNADNALWGTPAHQRDLYSDEITAQIASDSELSGWSSAHAISLSHANLMIKQDEKIPRGFTISVQDDHHHNLTGTFGTWRILPGSAGRNMNLLLPLRSCTLTSCGIPAGVTYEHLLVSAQIDLWLATAKSASNNTLRPVVTVLAVTGGEPAPNRRHRALIRLLLSQWCEENYHEVTSMLDRLGVVQAGFTGYACMDTHNPDTDMIGILSTSESAKLGTLQRMLPHTCSEWPQVVLVAQGSPLHKSILNDLPVLKLLDTSKAKLSHGEGEINMTGLSLHKAVSAKGLLPTVASFKILTDPHLHVELDICVTLPNGITVHLVLDLGYDLTLTPGKGKNSIGYYRTEGSEMRHYAQVPANIELTEQVQSEVANAVQQLALAVLA